MKASSATRETRGEQQVDGAVETVPAFAAPIRSKERTGEVERREGIGCRDTPDDDRLPCSPSPTVEVVKVRWPMGGRAVDPATLSKVERLITLPFNGRRT